MTATESRKEETGWLIEAALSSGPEYWVGASAWFSTDSLRAVRFARQADAEQVLVSTVQPSLQRICKAVEHMWVSA